MFVVLFVSNRTGMLETNTLKICFAGDVGAPYIVVGDMGTSVRNVCSRSVENCYICSRPHRTAFRQTAVCTVAAPRTPHFRRGAVFTVWLKWI